MLGSSYKHVTIRLKTLFYNDVGHMIDRESGVNRTTNQHANASVRTSVGAPAICFNGWINNKSTVLSLTIADKCDGIPRSEPGCWLADVASC